MKILFKQENGQLGILHPAPAFLDTLSGTEEEKLMHIADKDLPTGTIYEIVEDSVENAVDRTYFEALEYDTGANDKVSNELSREYKFKYGALTEEDLTEEEKQEWL